MTAIHLFIVVTGFYNQLSLDIQSKLGLKINIQQKGVYVGLGLHKAGSTVLPPPQPGLLPPAQPLVPVPSVVPALSAQFDDLATLMVTGRLPATLATAPALAPVQPAPVPADLQSVISSRMADIFPGPCT